MTFVEVLQEVPDKYRCSSHVVFFSFLLSYFLHSDLHCYLSEQLVGLLHDPASCWTLGLHAPPPPTHTAGRLTFPRLPQMRPLSCSETLLLHYFPENEIGKHKVQVIFTDLYVTIFLYVVCMPLIHSYFSVAFPPRSGMTSNQTLSTTCATSMITQTFSSSPKHLQLLSPLTPQRLCTSHPQLILF